MLLLFLLSCFPDGAKPVAHLSSPPLFCAGSSCSSCVSPRAPKFPKSKPDDAVFLFFLLPPNDHESSTPSSNVFLVLLFVSVASAPPRLVPPISHLLGAFQLLPQPPNPKPDPVPLVPVSVPKLRSSLGVSSRLTSSKLLVKPLKAAGGGGMASACGKHQSAGDSKLEVVPDYLVLLALFTLFRCRVETAPVIVGIRISPISP